jgi:acetolactate synthase-1/2/3 large subunit
METLEIINKEIQPAPKTTTSVTGSVALLEIFLAEKVETIFGYPGGAIMPIYDALYDYQEKMNHILVRHEQGAIHAAQG